MGKIDVDKAYNALLTYQEGNLFTTSLKARKKGQIFNCFMSFNAQQVAQEINDLFNNSDFTNLLNKNKSFASKIQGNLEQLNKKLSSSSKNGGNTNLLESALKDVQALLRPEEKAPKRSSTPPKGKTPKKTRPDDSRPGVVPVVLNATPKKTETLEVSLDKELEQLIAKKPQLKNIPNARKQLADMQKANPQMSPDSLITHFLLTHATSLKSKTEYVVKSVEVILGGVKRTITESKQVLEISGQERRVKLSRSPKAIIVADPSRPFDTPTYYRYTDKGSFEEQFEKVFNTNPLQEYLDSRNA